MPGIQILFILNSVYLNKLSLIFLISNFITYFENANKSTHQN